MRIHERSIPGKWILASIEKLGRLSAEIGHDGTDLMIAATAIEHGLSVVTRNTKHFAPTGVSVVNPFLPAIRLRAPLIWNAS